MKNLLSVIAFGFAVAFAGSAMAQEPATQAECEQVGGVWDEATSTCTSPR
jgi:hypothetical protein